MNNNNNEEISIDFNKIIKIIWNRRNIIFAVYAIIFGLIFVYSLLQPKKYISEAQLFINKAQDTNLAELNPFTIAEGGGAAFGGGAFSSLFSASSGLDNEIEIMKSPLVLKKVIEENNFKYVDGPKKGKYINASSFGSDKNLNIENNDISKIIKITYKSSSPEEAYNVINSIIKNYKQVNEDINSRKATNDKEFLQESYEKAKKDLETKIFNLKQFIVGNKAYSGPEMTGNFGLMGLYDKKLSKNLNIITKGGIESKKLEAELDLEIEKVKLIKTKLEWISLVEELSKGVTNITILKEPEIKESFEYSEPNYLLNFVFACLISFSLSLLLVVGVELYSKKLSYFDMKEGTILINNNEINLSKLKSKVISKKIKNLAVISLLNEDVLATVISKELSNNNISSVITNKNSIIDDHIKNIDVANAVVLIGKLKYTDRKLMAEIEDICINLNKEIISTFFIV